MSVFRNFTILFVISLSSIIRGQVTFNRSCDIGNFTSNAAPIVVCSDSSFVGLSSVYTPTAGGAIFYKYGLNGDTILTKRYWFNGSAVQVGLGDAAVELQDSTILYACGVADSSGNNFDFFIFRFTLEGDTLFTSRIGTVYDDKPNSITVINDSICLIVGYTAEPNGNAGDVSFVVYNYLNNNGVFNVFGLAGNQSIYNAALLENGLIVMSGGGSGTASLFLFDNQFNLVWDTVMTGMGSGAYCTSGPNGKFYTSCTKLGTGNDYDLQVNCFSSSGALLWQSVFNDAINACGSSAPLRWNNATNHLYVPGFIYSGSFNTEAYVLLLDSSGQAIYANRNSTPSGNHGYIGDFKLLGDGLLFYGFEAVNSGDPWLVRTDTAGCLVPGCLTNVSAVMNTADATLTVFPNPAAQAITIQLQVEERTVGIVEVYGLSGQVVLRQQVVFEKDGADVTVNIAELPTGLYSVVVRTGGGAPYVKRFVKAE